MQIALNDVLKDDGKILRVDADFDYPKDSGFTGSHEQRKAESVNTGQDGSYDSDSLRTLPGGSSGRV